VHSNIFLFIKSVLAWIVGRQMDKAFVKMMPQQIETGK